MVTEIILGVAALVLLYWKFFGKPSGLPPGRWGVPLFGYIPFNGKYLDDQLVDLQKKYGDIYLWKFGTILMVYVHDYNLCRQFFASQDFVDRPDMMLLKSKYEYALGVAGSNGTVWQTNRRFTLRHLRDLGMGKSSMVSAVQEQALNLVEALKENAGKEEPVTPALNTAIINIIWNMVASAQFKSDDPRHQDFQKLVDQMNTSLSYAMLADMFPWTKYILPSFVTGKLFQLDALDAAEDAFFKYFDELIEEHRASLDPSDPRDLMDAYLLEMDEMKKSNDENSVLRSDDDLKFLIFDMFIAGSDTTTSTMEWIFLYMAAYPDVQRKLQKEIDQVLPKGIMATLEDRSRMPYTDAVIHEVLRKSTLANIGFHHAASRDTTLAGYKIPKGTLITSFTAGIHHDPRYWDEPDSFLPGRWLNPEGKFVMKKEGFLPFGTGKRVCLGESLARMEILVFTTVVFQNFNVSPPEGKVVDLLPDQNSPFSHEPKKQDVVFTIRN